jgi:hypothetical protein
MSPTYPAGVTAYSHDRRSSNACAQPFAKRARSGTDSDMPRIPKRLIALGGLAAAGAAALRRRRAGRPSAPSPSAAPPAPAAAPAGAVAPPPVETPGPSVTPPGRGAGTGSETERAERAEATVPDSEVLRGRRHGSVDDLVDAEAAAAGAEAAMIGGPHLDDAHGDPAMEPVYEAGGGEAEGFEIAEDMLIENASHGDGRAEPISDAFTPEIESDEVTALDGEPDEEKVSEVVEDATEDAEARAEDPGTGPGITHDR